MSLILTAQTSVFECSQFSESHQFSFRSATVQTVLTKLMAYEVQFTNFVLS